MRFSHAIPAALAAAAWACSGGGGGGPAQDAAEAGPGADVTHPDSDDEVAPDAASEAGPDAAEEVAPLPAKVRFVHLSDVHSLGESGEPASAHVIQAVAKLNALDFAADFAVATGDLVEFVPDDADAAKPSNFSAAVDALKGLKWPLRTGVGNHEYYRDGDLRPATDRAARNAFLSAVLGTPLDFDFDHAGVRFVVMNSMSGEPSFENAGLVGSFTGDQLAWLRGRLEDGLPTFLFMHHPPTTGDDASAGDSLCDVIHAHPGQVKAVMAGHLHGFWKGEACGVPYFLVAKTDPTEAFYYLIEYDGEADVLTVVNEADLPFGTMPEYECDPGDGTVAAPAAAVGTHQRLRFGGMVSNLPGLEGFTGDQLDELPFVVRFDGWDGAAGAWGARLTLGQGKGTYTAYVAGSPCVGIDVALDGRCATSTQASFVMNLLPLLRALLDIWIDPAWVARIDVKSLWFEGRVTEEGGVPRLEAGLFHLAGTATQAVDDMRGILVFEYCAGRISGCKPGDAGMPACPPDAGPAFFGQVPEACDVAVASFGLRFVLAFLASYPLDNVNLVGEVTTEPQPTAATRTPGTVDERLFSTEPGSNCTPAR